MNSHKIILCALFLSILFGGCGDAAKTSDDDDQNVSVRELPSIPPENVKIFTMKCDVFDKELLSNGILRAREKAELKFTSQEIINNINFRNGDRVNRGDAIASLETVKMEDKVRQSRNALLQARLNLQDVLIGQGYTLADSLSVPAETMNIARVKSGFEQAVADLIMAEYDLEKATIKAPFNGIIANLSDKQYNYPSSTSFCTLINDTYFEAEFKVLESEIGSVKRNDKVDVMPVSGSEAFTGRVTAVNPQVNEKGLVVISALVENRKGLLFDGMNVNIKVKQEIGNCMVVPKSAVVIRSGKPVVFIHQGGKAIWKYVTLGHENSTCYTLLPMDDTVSEGDEVIYEGVVNLAHESPVTIKL